MLFLDADEETLLTRFKETRRRHPLAPGGSVAQGIAQERAVLEKLKDHAEATIDSTGLKASTLRRKIADEFLPREPLTRLAVTFQSFGFKHGPPRDADLTFDVRFLPNPHWEPELRPLTGHDRRVAEYVGAQGALKEFYDRLMPLLDFLIPQYLAEGKAHLMWRSAARAAATARWSSPRTSPSATATTTRSSSRCCTATSTSRPPARSDVRPRRLRGLDLARSAAFYDALFFPLGIRRMFDSEQAVAYGINDARFWITARDRAPDGSFGHVAFEATERRRSTRPTRRASRPAAAPTVRRAAPPVRAALLRRYLLDPDGLRVEIVAGSR